MNIAIGVFLDLSKAFDTVDHNILLHKLEHYGIHDVAVEWIRNYLSNRLQFVQFNDHCSSPQTVRRVMSPRDPSWAPVFLVVYKWYKQRIETLPNSFCSQMTLIYLPGFLS